MMNKKSIVTFSLLAWSAVFLTWCNSNWNNEIDNWIEWLANPASVYCIENGWTLISQQDTDWNEYSLCEFQDGTSCEEWAFYNWECNANNENVENSIPNTLSETNWILMTFNDNEVEWEYNLNINKNWEISVSFCNWLWWVINFEWDEKNWTIISEGLMSTLMFCEWESMTLEDAFNIKWMNYEIIDNEDWWKTLLLTSVDWNKFMWRVVEK